MEDNPNLCLKEQNYQAPLAITTEDHSPLSDAEPKRTSDKSDMPCGHRMNGRNLIVCIDGTSNQFGDKNTNVIELYNLILKEVDDNQRSWYNSGIGTYARPSWKSFNFYKKVLNHNIDLAIAWDFERTVLGAYRWLSDNYEQGDCIFLFGFSRGAFQVRVLSAMIDKVGLIYKGNEMQIPFAYELYADPKSAEPTKVTKVGSSAGESQLTSLANRFKSAFSHKDVKVHFVGAWDTVSSIGIARGKHMLPGTVEGMTHVCHFRHALALDERRVKFLPEYAYGGATKRKTGDTSTSEKGQLPHTKEVWFAGTHSDIGGGNVENHAMDRSRPPLRWMVFEAGAAGLRTARFERELLSGEQIDVIESLESFWLLLEILPFKRLTFTRRENGKDTTRKPHLGSVRKIHPGQKIHSSLLRAGDTIVAPKARPVDDDNQFWTKLRGKGINGKYAQEWLELDLYEHSKNAVESLINEGDDSALQRLQLAVSGDARQAVYEKVIEALNGEGSTELQPEVKHKLLRCTMDALKKSSQNGLDVKLNLSNEIRPLVSDLLKNTNKDYQKTAQEFVVLFTDRCLDVFPFQHVITCLSISSDGKHLVCGSDDTTFRIWDKETRKPEGEPFRGHTDWARCVAFSSDGERLVSGSDDKTVRIWDVVTGKPVGEPFRHADRVTSVAFSPDSKRVVSGSNDKTVRIWDIVTGKPVGEPFRHTDPVTSVAFSPDNRRVASGSYDKTVRIWDVKTGKPVGEPFRGHTYSVRSVAFSSDSKRVVSGSYDKTVRIWDVETGTSVGEPFQGHTDWVTSVAFSPDSKRVVSGSHDKTVRIWDVEAGRPVGEPFRRHTYSVKSVAFSVDGKHVVSGSNDKTVRTWDVETMTIG